jgi:formylglycine-generating enzyme required for sulfatase activity
VRITGILLLTVLFAFGCTTPPEPRPAYKRTKKSGTLFPEVKHQPGKTVSKPAPAPTPKQPKPKAPVQYTRPTVRAAPTSAIPRKFHLPTVIHHKDQSILVRVPAGSYWVPSENVSAFQMGQNRRLDHTTLAEFLIDQSEITVAQYKLYNPDYDETLYTGGEECPQCPAMAINWFNAQRYCKWAEKRLPTENEWEAAARGTSEHQLPWGDQVLERFGNIRGGQDGFVNAAPPGSFPKGASPFGALDMIGNVWEWVSTPITLPSLAESQPELKSNSLYPVKGGGWTSSPEMASISYRNLADPNINNPTFGFRCAKSANLETNFNTENPLQN